MRFAERDRNRRQDEGRTDAWRKNTRRKSVQLRQKNQNNVKSREEAEMLINNKASDEGWRIIYEDTTPTSLLFPCKITQRHAEHACHTQRASHLAFGPPPHTKGHPHHGNGPNHECMRNFHRPLLLHV